MISLEGLRGAETVPYSLDRNHGTGHSTSQHSTAHHITAQYITSQYSTAHHIRSQCSTAHQITVQYSTSHHITSQHSTAQHSTVQYSTAQQSIPGYFFRDIGWGAQEWVQGNHQLDERGGATTSKEVEFILYGQQTTREREGVRGAI